MKSEILKFGADFFALFLCENLEKKEFGNFTQAGFFDDFLIKGESFKKALNEFKNLKFQSLDEINSDFTELFLANIDGVKCPWFASFYFNQYAQIKTARSFLVFKEFYKPSNYDLLSPNLPFDALKNELGFISFCFSSELFKGEIFKKFLQDEFLPFAFTFDNLLLQESKTHFYMGFGLLFKDYLNLLVSEFSIKPNFDEIMDEFKEKSLCKLS
ncbi:hypothetical protein [Campylobacter geochelonis]|uniref:Uncharacterized component of anaerobic dehydrogenases n=1 Tax=Campylobacter geochelonis TaxID=1780362 RepID=A0A128EEM6_9BACT|nr:hypothetical protein [Campylobacter geochelonis]QKF72123.1 hypothetical protein CGEO_1857 [Campylobacter geochelonis]CZE46688.1 Uncharacterized component of anaerobic dehydrogenases [Campylobacter geochelonis]